MATDINKRILQLQVDTKQLKIEIENLNKEGKSSQEIFDKLGGKFQDLVDTALKLADSSKRSFGQTKDLDGYKDRLTKINTALTGIGASYKSVANAAAQANNEQLSGFKKLQSLQEEIALRNIQLSKKTNDDKLRDVIDYYKKVQQQYAIDSKEYLEYEKKKLDAQIKLEKSIDDARLKKRKADVEAAVKAETEEQKRRAKVQEAWDKRRESREKQEAEKRKKIEDVEIQNSISKFKLEASKHKQAEQEKTKTEKEESKKREAEEKKRDFSGGFGAQLTPRAIGGALGSLTKYLGLYQAINAAQRLFRELTLGSVREAIAFEKALANLGAVAGATGEEVQMLGKNALEVAGATKFTAEEIVGLQTELSKLGFSADDVVKSTQAIAFAAQALGSPLESTAALVGKLKNQFGLLIEETTMISDILVTSINESALSFESFGTAMQYVGPIANNLGLTLEQTAGAMAVLADNGFTASRIGTGLRGIFTELGKTSADVEKSLRDLAEQNISLSEAVDLVGKRNAAQLITLLKNIDAIDDANDRYYQQGRALISAAKQADTFSGQMDILTSNFREFQINLGNAVVDSNIFIKVLGLLSDKAEQTALGFKFLREVGLKDFQEDVEESIDKGIDPLTVSLDRMVESGKITTENLTEVKRAFEQATKESERLGVSLRPSIDALEELGITEEQFSMLEGYFNLLEDGIAKQREQTAITNGQNQATSIFGTELDALIDKSLKGINVNEEANKLYGELEAGIDSYTRALNSASGVTEEQRIEYEAAIKVLKGYQEQVNNTIISEEELAKRRKKAADERFRIEQKAAQAEIDAIKERYAEQIAAINERAKQETAIAETAEERADIEAKRQKLVSELYKKQAVAIGDLLEKYETQEDLINKNVKASEKLSEVLGSEVISDLNKAFKEYSTELTDLQKALKDGVIGQEDYEQSVAELRRRLETTISTFKEMFGTTPELEQFFNNLLINFDALTYKATEADDKVKKVHKTIEDFFKDFAEGDYLDYVSKAFDALGESLDEFNNTAAENTKNSLEAQLDSVRNRYDVESQILKSQLDNQLITESQFRQKQEELRKAQLAEENTINRQIFNAEKKQDVNSAKIDGLEAAAQAVIDIVKENAGNPIAIGILSALSTGIIAAQTTAQITAINQRKFFEKKFAEGGIVNGPSHDQGGVPFTVQGQAGYEMEGGEFVVNKRATAMHRDLLERINNSYRTRPTVGSLKFAEGGLVPSNPMAESVDYLKAIAEATTSTAIGVSRPVRAYVADKDLRSNATERRIRDRNDRL